MEDPKYCSPECQRTDWAVHKLLCASLKNFATPPAPNMRRAIYFKHDSEKPVYRWATTHHNEDEGQVYDNNHMEILGHSFGMLRVEVNPVRNKKLKNYIDIMYCNDLMGCSGTVEPQNDCLLKILVTPCRDWFAPEPREKTTFPWRGNIICYGGISDSYGIGWDSAPGDTTRDLNFADFRDIIDFSSVHRLNKGPMDFVTYAVDRVLRAKKIKGVHLHYASGQAPKYTPKLYPRDHPESGIVGFELSDAIGIPIRYFGTRLGESDLEQDPPYMILFPTLTTTPADVHVFRYDGKDILPEHLEFLMFLAREHMHVNWQEIYATRIREGLNVVNEACQRFSREVAQRDNWNRLWGEFKTREGLGDDFPDLHDM